MTIQFKVVRSGFTMPLNPEEPIAFLEKDNWDDYSFRTSFNLTIFDGDGARYNLGHVKIGYKDQKIPSDDRSYTSKHLPESFCTLDDIFSLGQDVEYYNGLLELPEFIRKCILEGLQDIPYYINKLEYFKTELVFKESLIRTVSIDDITDRFNPILNGGAALTPFKFGYFKSSNNTESEINLLFNTIPFSTPPSNIHVLIGRNGAGKTTILNNMVYGLLSSNDQQYGSFYIGNKVIGKKNLPDSYFSSAVLVSFSAFDSFEYPVDYTNNIERESDEDEIFDFSYIGLKVDLNKGGSSQLKNSSQLADEFLSGLKECFRFGHTKKLWLKAIKRLQSDDNFSSMNLYSLAESNVDMKVVFEKARSIFRCMSSGHAIVLLTITKLIITVKQKSLVLIDEPEGHLHPPLLSAFIHSLSDLLIHRNGIAIIATHSPVVLQEVPRKCVWNIIRYDGGIISPQRLETESYGENVGVLTREVFGLEVKESGFHMKLLDYVNSNLSYEEILSEHNNKLGLEGRSILKALTFNRDKRRGEDALN